MKCLVIHGSPRRSNTWEVLNMVENEMKRIGDFDFELIELSKEKIPTCIGCFNCIFKGEDKCPHKNFIMPLVKKIEEADALIITSPVYSMQLSGLLKNFIDHMSYNFHRPRFYNKKALIITTTAGAGHKDTAKYLEEVMYFWGVNYVMTIPIAYRSYELKESNKRKILKGARTFSKELLSNKLHEPSMKSIIMYNMWKQSADGKYKNTVADYNYWSKEELKNSVYYPGVPINLVRKIAAKIVSNMFNNS